MEKFLIRYWKPEFFWSFGEGNIIAIGLIVLWGIGHQLQRLFGLIISL